MSSAARSTEISPLPAMVALLTDYFRTHRIVASRAFAVMGLCVLLVTESAWDSTWLELGTFLAGVVLVGIATVGRLWCSVYISGYKTTKLITVGPYSITRNPLYFFSALGFVGVALVSEALILPMLVVALLMVFTPSVIEQEERVLAAKFGEEFSTYCRRTPRFWPRLSVYWEPDSWNVRPRILRRRLSDSLWFVWAVGLIEAIEVLHELHLLPTLLHAY